MSKPLDFDPAMLSVLAAPPVSAADIDAQLRALDAIAAWARSVPEGEEADEGEDVL